MTDSLLSVAGIDVRYGPIRALENISLDVAAGETTAVLGANGAGKSTLIRAIAGLVDHDGSISFKGEPLERSPDRVAQSGIGHVPEGRQIFTQLSVVENLRLGGLGTSRAVRTAGVERAIELFPVLGERAHQSAGTMSGGEQQMIAIGRALVANPTLLLMDEPTLGLAPILVDQIYSSIRTIRESGTTVLLVEQQAERARAFAVQTLLLRNGHEVAIGAPGEVLTAEALAKAYLT